MVITADPLALTIFLVGFFISRAVGGIVGEYAKRIWFTKIEPYVARLVRRLLRQPEPYDPILRKIADLEGERDRLIVRVEALLAERDRIDLEQIRRRITRDDTQPPTTSP